VIQQVDELEADQARIKNARILVVEGDPFDQLTIQDLLCLVGAVTVVVSNKREALERLAIEQFDLVLIDVRMAVRDDIETACRIQEKRGFSGQRMIAMTDTIVPQDRKQWSIIGIDDFIFKPINPDQLYLTMAKWIPDKTITQDGRRSKKTEAPIEHSQPVDISAMHRMFHNNAVLVRKFGLKFIEIANSVLAEMQIAQVKNDLPMLGRLGHKLKSSARTIGAASFADLCESLEKTAVNNDRSGAELVLPKITTLLEQITQQLEREFNERDE